jgi:hypothetical protein
MFHTVVGLESNTVATNDQNVIDSNVLQSLPFIARRAVVTETTNALYQAGPGSEGAGASISSQGTSSLSSIFHVRWTMEVLGQAFALPLEDISVVSNATSIYISWLLEPEKRPPAIQKADGETLQQFLQIIFRQVSVLFQPKRIEVSSSGRPQLATLASKHVELCKSMLRSLAQVATSSQATGPQNGLDTLSLSTATWKVLLHVLLEVSNSLLKAPLNPYCYLAEELGDLLMSIFLELWLRSQIFSASLWKSLSDLFPLWTHRMLVVSQWSAISLALTQRATKLLYGQGTAAVVYTVNSNLVTLELSDQYVVYAWYRVLHLIASPQHMASQVFFRSVLGVEKLVQVFHSISHGDHESTMGLERLFPDANTILHIFGSWLFEAVAKTSVDCAEGRAQAFGVLCRIITRPQRRNPILTKYLHQFYSAIIEGIRGDLLSLVFIVVNCEDIFALGLPGVRILVAPFVLSLRKIIPNMEKPLRVSINMDDLRRACYKLYCTLFGFCDHFSSIPMEYSRRQTDVSEVAPLPAQPSPRKSAGTADNLTRTLSVNKISLSEYDRKLQSLYANSMDSGSNNLGSLRYWILETLVASFLTENDPGNLRYLINTLAAFAIDDNLQTPGLVALVAQIVSEQLCSSKWSVDVCLVAVEILRQLSSLQEAVLSTEKGIIRSVIISMCTFTQGLVARNNLPVLSKLIMALFECMLDWILGRDYASTWFATDLECQAAVIQLLSGALTYGSSMARRVEGVVESPGATGVDVKPKSSPSPRTPSSGHLPPKSLEAQLASLAEIALARLLNFYGSSIVNPFFPKSQSTLLNECFLLGSTSGLEFVSGRSGNSLSSLSHEQLQSLRYFLINESIIACFVERPLSERSSNELVAILRSTCGRFTWESSEIFTLDPARIVNSVIKDGMNVNNRIVDHRSPSTVLADSTNAIADGDANSKPLLLSEIGPLFNEALLQERFSRDERRILNFKCIEGLAREQATLSENIQPSEDYQIHLAEPSNVTSPSNHLARLFLSHFGMSSVESRESIVRLPSSPELLRDLEALDALPEREIISCSVLFIRSGGQPVHEILKDESVSKDFVNFVHSLGWPVDPRKQNTWNNYPTEALVRSFPYFANSMVELTFHVPSLLPISLQEKHRDDLHSLLAEDLVTVLWIEDLQDMLSLPSKLQTQSIIFICISPLPDEDSVGLYRIRIMVTSTATMPMSSPSSQATSAGQSSLGEAVFLFGPLLDGMIVQREAIGRLVQETVISACLFCLYNIQNQQRP